MARKDCTDIIEYHVVTFIDLIVDETFNDLLWFYHVRSDNMGQYEKRLSEDVGAANLSRRLLGFLTRLQQCGG